MRSLVTEAVKTVDAVDQQLGSDAVGRLQQVLERPYSIVCMPCSVASTEASKVATFTIPCRGEGSGDDRKLEPVKSHVPHSRQCFAKATRRRVSDERRSLQHLFCFLVRLSLSGSVVNVFFSSDCLEVFILLALWSS